MAQDKDKAPPAPALAVVLLPEGDERRGEIISLPQAEFAKRVADNTVRAVTEIDRQIALWK